MLVAECRQDRTVVVRQVLLEKLENDLHSSKQATDDVVSLPRVQSPDAQEPKVSYSSYLNFSSSYFLPGSSVSQPPASYGAIVLHVSSR